MMIIRSSLNRKFPKVKGNAAVVQDQMINTVRRLNAEAIVPRVAVRVTPRQRGWT